MDDKTYLYLFVPALLYGVLLGLRKDEEGQRWGILSVFLLLSTGMFITSVGWPRFAVAPLVFGALFVARLLYGLTHGFRPDWQGLRALLNGKDISVVTLVNVWLIGWSWVLLLAPIQARLSNAVNDGDDYPYVMARYLEENVPKTALIETWEAQLAALTDHNYHYAPQIVEAYVIRALFLGGTPAADLYDFREYVDPDYVIVGSSGKWAKLYPEDRLVDYELVFSVGKFDVYKRRA